MNHSFKKLKTTLFVVWLLPAFIFCQIGPYELGGFAGFAFYQGDLAEDHIELKETRISKGLFLRVHFNEYFSLKTAYYNGFISGDDKNSSQEFHQTRAWRFHSKLNEFSLIGEWNILGTNRLNNFGRFKPKFTPVLFMGIAQTKANSVLVVPEKDKHLFPESGNKNSFLAVPIGIAIRYDFLKFATISGEFGWRSIFSDYLDNVSENGGRDKNDWYSYTGINISILLGQVYFD